MDGVGSNGNPFCCSGVNGVLPNSPSAFTVVKFTTTRDVHFVATKRASARRTAMSEGAFASPATEGMEMHVKSKPQYRRSAKFGGGKRPERLEAGRPLGKGGEAKWPRRVMAVAAVLFAVNAVRSLWKGRRKNRD